MFNIFILIIYARLTVKVNNVGMVDLFIIIFATGEFLARATIIISFIVNTDTFLSVNILFRMEMMLIKLFLRNVYNLIGNFVFIVR